MSLPLLCPTSLDPTYIYTCSFKGKRFAPISEIGHSDMRTKKWRFAAQLGTTNECRGRDRRGGRRVGYCAGNPINLALELGGEPDAIGSRRTDNVVCNQAVYLLSIFLVVFIVQILTKKCDRVLFVVSAIFD